MAGAQASGAQAQPFSVAEVLSSPHPSSLTAAPTGGHVAWVFNAEGTRDVWVGSPSSLRDAESANPAYTSRRLTDFGSGVGDQPGRADDGQEISSIAWSPSGERLAFVRGGAPNRAGELPNPLSVPTGVTREVWIVGLDGSDPVKVGVGRNPLWLSEQSLLLLRAGSLMRADVAEREPGEGDSEDGESSEPSMPTTKVLSVRGGLSQVTLSPDRTQVAFVSSRGAHSFVGVLDLGSNEVSFLDPAVDQDTSPVFAPDGQSLAFLRLPPQTNPSIFAPAREGPPWSIRVVDLETKRGREVFRAQQGRGSVFRGVVADRQLVWTGDNRLVFPWEREGWTHLYSVSAGPKAQPSPPQLLTPGAFEVEYVAAMPDGKSVAFSSNQDDIDRRHLWLVAAAGEAVTALTATDGVENAPTPLSNGAVAFVAASGTHPLEPRILWPNDGTSRPLAPGSLPASFPLAQMVEPEAVLFPATDGLEIHGQLFRPPARFSGKRPAAIFFHGGSRRHMMLGWHYSSYYHNSYAFHQYLANQGYVVLSVNYRSGIGYGMEFREALDYGATGGSELRDVLGAGLYLRGRDDVDSDRIGLWGGSYGGYLTAMGLSRASDLFAAGVDIHGVHDWNRTIKNFIPSYEPLEDPERARLAFESSPMAQVEDWRSPVLLVHGDDDRNVPFAETVVLVEKLREQGVEHELLIYPDEVHSFLRHKHWVEIFERAAAFFDKHLASTSARSERNVAAVN